MTANDTLSKSVVLCIEDEADFRENISEEMEEAGLLVIQAESAEHALTFLDGIQPDLILCDVAMPGMDGYELLEIVRRKHPELSDVPFVFLTAHSDPQQVAAGKWAGVDDYLVKPVDFDLLMATLHARLSQVARIREHHRLEVKEVHRAVLQLHQEHSNDTVAGIAQAFDYVSFGIILLNDTAEVCLANRAAVQMAQTVPGLMNDTQFAWGNHRRMAALRDAIGGVLAQRGHSDEAYACVSIPRDHDRRDLLCMIYALPDTRGGVQSTDDYAAMLIISDPAHRHSLAPKMLESLFGLTPTEAQIATAFARGSSTGDIARDFNISTTTVAFHKRNLFDKTQTRRQADLVALLLSLPVYSTSNPH